MKLERPGIKEVNILLPKLDLLETQENIEGLNEESTKKIKIYSHCV